MTESNSTTNGEPTGPDAITLEIHTKMRAMHRKAPERLDAVIQDYNKHGAKAFEGRKPGRKQEIPMQTLAMLYADVENAKARGITERAKLKDLAENGCKHGRINGVGTWLTTDAIRHQLNKAKKLHETDPAFRAEVERWQGLMKIIEL